MLGTLAGDLRFASRMVAKAPGFSAVVIVTLALGIGANTALFSVVHGVLLQPLPYPEPERLVFLQEASERGGSLTVSYPNFEDWRAQAAGVSEMVAGYPVQQQTVYGLEETITVPLMGVSRGFFRMFGAEMLLGRRFRDDENLEGAETVVIVSHRFWSRWLGANPDLEALELDFGGDRVPVVGVLQPGFRFLGDVDVWYPFERRPIRIRNAHNHWVVARLAEGVTLEAVDDQLDAIAAAIKRDYPDDSQAVGVHVTPLRERIVGATRQPLLILMAAAALVLLVACTNVASSLLARGAARQGEFAVRRAVGAGRGRMISQLVTESLVLAAVGTVLGLALASTILRLLRFLAAGNLPRLHEVRLEPAVLTFCLASMVLAVLLFGLLPALRISRAGGAFEGTGRGVATSGIWRGLVGVEVALSVILLVGSGLLVRSLVNIVVADTGFDRRGVVTMQFSLPSQRYRDNEARLVFLDRLGNELSAVPGVETVGLVNALPLSRGFKSGPVAVVPYTDPEDPDEWDAFMRWRIADAGYFEAMGIDLLRGRLFDDSDVEGAPGVAVINRSLAEQLWPDEDPLGKQLRATWDFRGEDLTVVGVVEEARHWASEPGDQAELYVAWRQRPEHANGMVAVVRSPLPAAAIGPAVRDTLRSLDADVLGEVATLDQRLFATLTDRNFNLLVLGGFAAVALLLSLAGIYGVVSYAVARRTREIGIRMALGARPARVVASMQAHTLLAVIVGAAAGCAAAAALSRLMSGLLYGIEPMDATTLVAAPALLLAVAALASWVPARRSARVDPVHTLRAE
jgi:predicted permease